MLIASAFETLYLMYLCPPSYRSGLVYTISANVEKFRLEYIKRIKRDKQNVQNKN